MKPESQLNTIGGCSQTKPRATTGANNPDRPKILLVSRLLLNSQIWCQGDIVVVEGGRPIQLTPRFQLEADPVLQTGDNPLTCY
jgi:hypothetical protein